MKLKKVLVVCLIAFFISGCSRIDWLHRYRNVNEPEKYSYIRTCNNGSFTIGLYDNFCFRMVGPAYIPIIPLPLSLSSDLKIYVKPQLDSSYSITDIPEIAIRKKGSNFLIKPTRIDTSGRKPYLSYYIHFDEGFSSSDTIEVVFKTKYNECELLPISYFLSTERVFDPLLFPAH